jgi:membrane protein YqaA with SNARE-associated domain
MTVFRSSALATLWGFAEATVFFIVPDVLLTWIALQDYKRALIACVWALAGALLGGSILWFIGSHDPDPTRALFSSLPAIDNNMIANVRWQIDNNGPLALFVGPFIGTPYKIYAVEAGGLGIGLGLFLLISIPARMMRFAFAVVLAGAISHLLRKRFKMSVIRGAHVVAWVVFYSWYFHAMSR